MNSDDTIFIDSLGQKWRKDYFAYAVSFVQIPKQLSFTEVINIESDSQFVWTKTSTDITFSQPLVISITDSGSGRQLQNIPLNILTIAGNGGLPFVLPQPRLFKENSSIQVVASNQFNGVDDYFIDCFLTFHGYKLFRM